MKFKMLHPVIYKLLSILPIDIYQVDSADLDPDLVVN